MGYWLTDQFNRVASKWVFRHLADHVLVNAMTIREQLIREYGISCDKITVISNGVDIRRDVLAIAHRQELRRRLGCRDTDVVLGLVANLRPVKGAEYAIRATHLLLGSGWNVKLIIVGDGDQRGLLEQIVRESGIDDHVMLLGNYSDPLKIIPVFDIALLCSLSEGFPQTVLEYMACGKPVVATAVGGVSEIIRNGETGFLVPACDPQALARAIEALMTDESLRETMGQRGQEEVEKRYPLSAMISKHDEIYHRLLNERIDGVV
jgi:glycosyltransferase involved in cell wall biosynthesis